MKKRNANLELLRIVAMFMIIFLHYLDKGGTLLMPWDEDFCVNSGIAWFIEALCICATNIYVLISGYFMVTSEFHIEKCFKLWLQIFFYSAGIFALMLAIGQVPLEKCTDVYYLSHFLFPVNSQHYWFASTYFAFYLLSPFLAVMIRKLSKNQLKALIIVMLVLFSATSVILLPTTLGLSDNGMGVLWFICLFAIAAYIWLYVPKLPAKGKCLLLYLGASALAFASIFVISFVFEKTGKMINALNIFYRYHSPLIVVSSVSMFLVFLNMKIKEGFLSKAILKISGLTFGIYLVHEHETLRELWIDFWHVDSFSKTPWFLLHCFGVVLTVFCAGAVVEFIRQLLFGLLYRSKLWKLAMNKVSKVDRFFNVGKEEVKE